MEKKLFEELYLNLYPGFFRLAQSILRNTVDAEDAVQQSAEKAWKAWENIKAVQAKAYLTRILINECRNIQRHRMRVTPRADLAGKEPEKADNDLFRAISGLPEKYRLPLLLRFMEGYSEKETAETLKISVAALKSRVFRARNQLKDMIIEESEKQ